MLLTTVFVFLLRFYKIFKITFSFSKIYFFSLKNSFFSPVIRIWMCFEEPGWHAIEDVSDWFKSHVRNRFRFSTSHLSLCSATYRPWGSLDFLTVSCLAQHMPHVRLETSVEQSSNYIQKHPLITGACLSTCLRHCF